MFIGKNTLGSQFLGLFLKNYVFTEFDDAFVSPKLTNILAIQSYFKAGFKIVRSSSKEKIFWMLLGRHLSDKLKDTTFNQLAMRESLFHPTPQINVVQLKQNYLI
jgi:hypothetical protein